MTSEEFSKFIANLGEAFNRRDLDTLGAFYAEDATRYWPPWGTAQGREDILKMREALFRAFPDVSWKLHHWDVSLKLHHRVFGGDYGFVEWTMTGTHTGTLNTPLVSVPATGKKVEVSGTAVFEFDSFGKILEERVYFDVTSMLRDFGLQLSPAPVVAFPDVAKGGTGVPTRSQVLGEVKQCFGVVPEWIERLPEGELQHEWGLIRSLELGRTAIPHKFKELIGLAVASALRCRYSTFYHTEAARLYGATEEEVREAVLMAKLTAGLSTYLAGGQFDHERFKRETAEMVAHARKVRAKKAA